MGDVCGGNQIRVEDKVIQERIFEFAAEMFLQITAPPAILSYAAFGSITRALSV